MYAFDSDILTRKRNCGWGGARTFGLGLELPYK